MVELGGIHCIQRNLNNNYVESLMAKCPSFQESDNTVRFCLPLDDELQESDVKIEGIPPDTIVLSSENTNLRILGIAKFKHEETRYPGVGFVYGFGSPLISVIEYKNMYFIKNGYHRAYALLKKGHKFLPCLLGSTDNLNDVVSKGENFFQPDFIKSDKSLILSDFATPAAVSIIRPAVKRKITMHAKDVIDQEDTLTLAYL